jgi:hypothetical protein
MSGDGTIRRQLQPDHLRCIREEAPTIFSKALATSGPREKP